jgi:hypothetical protein
MSERPITPIKQTHITVGGQTFLAVLLPDGQAGLLLSQLCEWLGLYLSSQARNIRAYPTLAKALVLVEIETVGGPQATNVLLSWGIILWLERIRWGRRPEMYRERLEALQRDAHVTLSKEFFQNPIQEPTPPPKREKPSAGLEKPRSLREARQKIRQARAELAAAEEEWMDLVEQGQQAPGERLQRPEGQPAPAERAAHSQPLDTSALVPFMPLTVRQYRELVALLRQLQRQTGVPLETLAAEVADHCGADDLTAITQTALPEALAWVRRRLSAR